MRHYTRVEGGDAYWKLLATYNHREAHPQEGGGIGRAWISDPKVYSGKLMPNDGAHAVTSYFSPRALWS